MARTTIAAPGTTADAGTATRTAGAGQAVQAAGGRAGTARDGLTSSGMTHGQVLEAMSGLMLSMFVAMLSST